MVLSAAAAVMDLILKKKTLFNSLKEAGQLSKNSKLGLDVGVKCVLGQLHPSELTEDSIAKIRQVVSSTVKRIRDKWQSSGRRENNFFRPYDSFLANDLILRVAVKRITVMRIKPSTGLLRRVCVGM